MARSVPEFSPSRHRLHVCLFPLRLRLTTTLCQRVNEYQCESMLRVARGQRALPQWPCESRQCSSTAELEAVSSNALLRWFRGLRATVGSS